MSKHTEAIREALAKNPTPGPWLIADGDRSFVYALGPDGTNSFWAQVESAGHRRLDDWERAATAGFIAACNPENIAALLAERDALLSALCSIGVIGPGYCFCSHDRDPDKTDHQPECADARAAIRKATGEQS